jgi:hypothetical protein
MRADGRIDRYAVRQAVLADAPKLYALDHVAQQYVDRGASIDRAIRETRSWN